MASSDGRQNTALVSEKGKKDNTTGLKNSEGGDNTNTEGGDNTNTEGGGNTNTEGGDNTNTEGGDNTNIEGGDNIDTEGGENTNMEGNPSNVGKTGKLLGTCSFKGEGYQMEVSVQKAGNTWLLKCGDKAVHLPEEMRQIDKLEFNEGILVHGEKMYQLKESNGSFVLVNIDYAQLDQENDTAEKMDGDDCDDEKKMATMNSNMRASHNVIQLSNQNRQNTQSQETNNIFASKSTDMKDSIGTRKQISENLPVSDLTTNTEVVTTAEKASRTSDKSLTDKTSEHIDGASPPLPPRCPNSSVSSTDVYENISNSLPPGEDLQIANQSTSIKDNSGTGKSTLPKKPIAAPRQSKGVKLDPLMGRINSKESKKIQTETDEGLFSKESNSTERMQQSCEADCFTGAENDKDKSSEPPILPKKEKTVSLAKDDGAPENGPSPTPPPRRKKLGQNQENPCGTQKSEETVSGRKNEGIGKEYEIHLSVKYRKSKHFSSDLSNKCNLDTYLRWHYVLGNSQALNEKLDQLKAMNIHVTVEKEEEDLWVNIDLGKLEKTLSELDIGRIKNIVMEALMCDTETLVRNSFPATGIDRTEAVKLMIEKSREEMGSELWLCPDDDTDVIHYIYPPARGGEVDTCIQAVTKTLLEEERILSLPLVFSKLFEQNNVKLELKREYRLTMAIDCLETENECRVTLKGTRAQVENGWSWINTKFVDNYAVNEIGFKDIKKQGANISEEIIVQDVLSQAAFEHVTWFINESCRKIGICSTNRVAVDKAIAGVKRGIRKEEFPLELYQSLADVQAVKEGRAILEKTDKSVQVVGTDTALTGIKQFVEKLKTNGQENKTIKQGQINKDNDQNQHFKVTEATISFVVDDLSVFERLCNSAELRNYAEKLNVKLNTKHKDRRGIFLTGSSDGCAKVKEMLQQMVEQKKFSAKASKEQWTLSYGRGITVQCPTNMSDVNFVVGVDTVPPEQAKFDRKQKTLLLPEWIDGCRKETERTETCLKELLMFTWNASLYRIQIDLPEIHKKIAKHFTHGLFTLLSGEEFKEKRPLQLFICTDSQDTYTCLIESCKQSKQTISSVLHRSTSVSIIHETPTPDIEISVISGQLNGTKADVIVNTTSKDLNLSNGKVSQALLQSAGQELQSEVTEKCPKGINFGEIVVTRGYRLQGCKCVFHGALESFSAARNIGSLYRFIVDCLSEADSRKCEKIAFPAIGTGRHDYPPDQVACAMFSAVRSFERKKRHLREVLFVIYHEDQYTIKDGLWTKLDDSNDRSLDLYQASIGLLIKQEFRKQEECNEAVKRLAKDTGKIRISIDYGTLTYIFTTGIIYVWDCKSSHNAKLKEHALLSHVGADVQKVWKNHRENRDMRDKPLKTTGGQLQVPYIVHVFCQDDLESLKVAINEGLQEANNCDSVTLFCDKNIKLLNYGESVVDVFQDCIKGIQMSETSLHYVSMSLDNIGLVARFQTHLTKSSASETASGRPSVVSGMGARDDREPEDQSISDRGGVGDGGKASDQNETWKIDQDMYLKQGSKNVTDNYVLVKDIPATYTESELEEVVKDCCPKLQYSTIFVPGMSEAVIKCNDKKDTTMLVSKEHERVKFTQFPAQSMMQFSTEVEYAAGKQTVKCLKEKDIQAKVKMGKTYITAPTELQLKYAVEELEKTGCGFRDSIEVTEDVWDIVEILKEEKIAKLQEQGQKISYNEGHIIFSDHKKKTEDPNWTVVKSCLLSLKDKQILEVTIKEENVDTINKWNHEIQTAQEKGCCVFVEKRKTVLVCDDSYENLQRIKHQLLIKDGQVKVTGRKKRVFNEMNPIFPAGEENEPQTSTNILPVVEAESKSCTDRNQEDRATQSLEKKQEFNLKFQTKNLQVYDTAESIKIYVYEANILKLPVDCIVNAANDTLQHGGGIAKVIAVAAGRSLDKEGLTYIAKHGKIPVGKTCVTTAGNLHYDCVIHAVGPRWLDYSPHSLYDVQRCEKDLYSAIMESLLAAEEKGLESIALPAISAAIFGVPEELCVYHYAKATVGYSKRKSPTALKEIHFIDINSKIIRSIQEVFDAFLISNRSPHYSTEKFVQTKVKPSRPRSKSPERTKHRGRDTDTKLVYTYYSDDLQHIIETQKCRLVIQLGDIIQIKATAIVSIEDSKGSGRGKISKLIEGKMIGRSKYNYQERKKQLFAKDKETGEVILTDGFSSGYKYILHAVLPHDVRNFHPIDREFTIKRTLQNILKTLDDRLVDSIVMCLLGAGEETKDEIDVAADAFIKTFKTYCEQGKRGQSKHLQITLVCRQENILNWVLQKFRDHGIIEHYTKAAPALPPRLTKRSESLTEDTDNKENLEDCVICMEKITKRKVLQCGHAFDKDCIKQAFKVKKVCPTCGMLCGKLKGDQPEGKMKVNIETYSHCAGYEQCGRISITYTFSSGKQGPNHPDPGRDYRGITRTAYLPDNDEGNEVLEMLRLAFDRKLIFTIGSSRTTGEEGVITWNDIHHKTNPQPYSQFGYPDPTYLERVKDELAAKGITPEDIRKAH